MTAYVRTTESDGVVTLTLDRPEKLNAFAEDMREQLRDALDAVAARPDLRVLVLTGAGSAFCAGGDVRHMVGLAQRAAGFDALEPLLALGGAIVTRVASLPCPTIAAVNGPAAGAGMNLALACDLRIASDQATFGETFVRIGLHPDWGGTYFLPRIVGLAKALELCWLGEPIDAREALRIGLVSRVVPHDQLTGEVEALARRLAESPRASIRLAKQTLTASRHRTLEQCLEAEAEAQAACWASPDVAEGLAAFVEKRPPRFGAEADAAVATSPSAAARRFE